MATDTTEQPVVEISRTFKSPPEKVFAAWTTPEAMKQWHSGPGGHTEHASVDLRVGGRYSLTMVGGDGIRRELAGTYHEVTPPSRLVYSWQWQGRPGAVESLVTVEFQPHHGGTRLVVTHALLPDDNNRVQHTRGWQGCLDKLQQLVP